MALAFLLLLLQPVAKGEDLLDRATTARQTQRWDEALSALEQLRRLDAEAYAANNLPYLEAVVRSQSGDLALAEKLLVDLLGKNEFPRENVLLRLLDLSEGRPIAAREDWFEVFVDQHRDHPRWGETLLRYGQALEDAGLYAKAKKQYDRLWKARIRGLSRKAALGHALLHVKANQRADAIKDLEKLLAKSEIDEVAYRAAQALHQLQPVEKTNEVSARRRARVFLNNRRTETARQYLRRLIDDFPGSLSSDQYAYLWGRSFVVEERFEEGVRAYLEAYGKHPDGAWGVYSHYLAANTALRRLDYPTAARIYRQVIDRHHDSKYVPRAYYNLADCRIWMGEVEEAEKVLREGLRKLPARKSDPLRYQLARIYVKRKAHDEALRQLEKLDHLTSRRLPDGVTREEIYFWKGHCLRELGRDEEAAAAYREAAAGRPNYFGYFAKKRLSAEAANPPASPFENWENRLLAARPWFASTEQRSVFQEKHPRQAQIRDFLFLGLHEEAALEIKRRGRAAFDGSTEDWLFNLAFFADRGRLPEDSLAAAERLRRLAFPDAAPEQLPSLLRPLLYPWPYREAVETHARRNGVEPQLILSVIRQESRFHADAKSPAAARGLMQFMAATARQLAGELRIPKPREEDLYDPELSVQLGSYYLAKLIARFDGSVEKALAAYNGGSDNVDRWASKIDGFDRELPEFFVANIGFRETKLYVLKVMGNYFAYREIYGEKTRQSVTEP